MGSICAWRGGGWPSGPLHPVTWRLSHLFLCVHSRIYIPPALLLSHGVRKGVSSSRPSPPGPPMGVQVPACYTQEKEKVTSSSERGESGGGVCLSRLAITSALGSGTGPRGGNVANWTFPAPETQIQSDLDAHWTSGSVSDTGEPMGLQPCSCGVHMHTGKCTPGSG